MQVNNVLGNILQSDGGLEACPLGELYDKMNLFCQVYKHLHYV